MLEVFAKAQHHGDRIAVLSVGNSYTYDQLLRRSRTLALGLLNGRTDLNEDPVAFMAGPGYDYVSVLWGIWRAGGIAVPLCLTHPEPALEHVLRDTACGTLVVTQEYSETTNELVAKLGIQSRKLDELTTDVNGKLPDVAVERRAMILYTSGTTNLPKGVVTTHRNIEAQIRTLVRSWRWSAEDHTLCVLPLHHVHGIVNVLSCALWSGACCEFQREFEATEVFRAFLEGRVNVFMAVPTIYFKLIAAWEKLNTVDQQSVSAALRKMRLMVSGSAALPVSVMERWQSISGHRLLERYGMTELGMAIGNPYDGERKAGYVGMPLEGVEVRLCNDQNVPVVIEHGEIQVRGENVFLEYWRQPQATRDSFTADGWFKTGDVATVEDGYYRILGRNSVDIIKSGGYKISALEIEEVLRTHPGVADCAVVGLDDEEWGEVVAAALVPKQGELDPVEIKNWLKERIPAYRVPRKILQSGELPRNAIGKVIKNDVKKLFQP